MLTSYSMQLPGKNLLARFSISSLGNTKLNICCANLIISIQCAYMKKTVVHVHLFLNTFDSFRAIKHFTV